MELRFCNLDHSHLSFIDDILMPAYQFPTSRAPDVRRYLGWNPRCWLLLYVDDQPAATGGCVIYDDFAYVGLIAVHPDFQGRGLGKLFVEHLMEETKKLGCTQFLLDASAAGAPLYRKMGYQTTSTVSVYDRETLVAPPQIAANIRLLQADDLPALAAFDTPIFGTSRLQQLHSLLQEFPERCFISHNAQGQINGYIMAQSSVIGPWIASDEQAAEALLGQVLDLPYATKPRILMPLAHHTAILERAGFVHLRTLEHMVYGQTPPTRQLHLNYGQLSLAAG